MAGRTRLRLQIESVRARARKEQVAHFLHIGKTAGTAVKFALKNAPAPSHYQLRMHTHGVRMMDIPRRDKFFFVVRDPVDRFASGFGHRQRKGQPRFNEPWSPAEERAFARFGSPQELADGLASEGADRSAAVDALNSIDHVNRSYWFWFGSPLKFRRRFRDVLFVGFQESLDQQMPALADLLGVASLELPDDDVSANRTTRATGEELTPAGRAVLADWYARDYEFLALCRELAADN
jgi:hypothetical protein